MCAKFEVFTTPPSGFLPIDTPFLANMRWEYFSFNIWTVVYQSELEVSNFDQNWAKSRRLLLKIWELPISIAIVDWCNFTLLLFRSLFLYKAIRSRPNLIMTRPNLISCPHHVNAVSYQKYFTPRTAGTKGLQLSLLVCYIYAIYNVCYIT